MHTGPTVKSLGTLSIDRIKIRGSRAQLFFTALLSGEQGKRGREPQKEVESSLARCLTSLFALSHLSPTSSQRERLEGEQERMKVVSRIMRSNAKKVADFSLHCQVLSLCHKRQ